MQGPLHWPAPHPVLFKEDTLPPEALVKFASVTSADVQEQQASAAAAAAAEGAGRAKQWIDISSCSACPAIGRC